MLIGRVNQHFKIILGVDAGHVHTAAAATVAAITTTTITTAAVAVAAAAIKV